MALVDYSGSESESDSINEENAPTPESAKPAPTSNKPTFQKVVDRSNPHKIKVTLPEPAMITAEDGNSEGPPAKRAKTGSGGMDGFNSFLPAPKRTAAPSGGSGGGGIRRGGLAGGVSLKTGAAPGFSREAAPSIGESSDWNGGAGGPLVEETQGHGRHSDTTEPTAEAMPDMTVPGVAIESKKKSTMFRPLSVANKKSQKKKDTPISSLGGAASSSEGGTTPQAKSKPKASLFSASEDTKDSSSTSSVIKATYQPIVYHANKPTSTPTTNLSPEDPSLPQDHPPNLPPDQTAQAQQPQSLSAIATDLNLSASAKRQLLGRHHKPTHQPHPSQAPTNRPKIVNFNTDEEYAANELLRQAGEAVQHNPVRGIAPGKHSLKQLVNAASNQKDALEEQFASGRRNKKEAGSKYGW